MWELKKAERQRSITSLLNREPKDLVLLSKDGGRVAIQSLLVALHSPLLAELLLETGLGTAISLPFPLSALSSLADVLQDRQGDHDDGADVLQDKQGGHDDGVDCLQDVAFSLGISLRAVTSKLVKREVQNDRDEGEDVQDNLDEQNKEEMIDKKPNVQKAKQKQKIRYVESSSESSDDDNDPDYMDISNDTVKSVITNHLLKVQQSKEKHSKENLDVTTVSLDLVSEAI